jgi:hypothetical protein
MSPVEDDAGGKGRSIQRQPAAPAASNFLLISLSRLNEQGLIDLTAAARFSA